MKQSSDVKNDIAHRWNIRHQNWRCFSISFKQKDLVEQYEYLGTMAIWDRLFYEPARIKLNIGVILDRVCDHVGLYELEDGKLLLSSMDDEDVLFSKGNNILYGGFYGLEALSVLCQTKNTQAGAYKYCVASSRHVEELSSYGEHAIRSWMENNRRFFTTYYDRHLLKLPETEMEDRGLWRFNGLYLVQEDERIYKYFSSIEEACKWENSESRPRGEKRYHCIALSQAEAMELNHKGDKAIKKFMEDHYHAFLYPHERNLPFPDFSYPEGRPRNKAGKFMLLPQRRFVL
ncbi:MAG: hypothetical protein ACOYK8_02910 [Alphaproteobacteria bacterium]